MFKPISVALVAVSLLVAPAIAGTAGKTAQAPVNKIAQAPVAKAEQGKAKLTKANARMDRHHHRHHKQTGLRKAPAKHIAVKHITPSAKRS